MTDQFTSWYNIYIIHNLDHTQPHAFNIFNWQNLFEPLTAEHLHCAIHVHKKLIITYKRNKGIFILCMYVPDTYMYTCIYIYVTQILHYDYY